MNYIYYINKKRFSIDDFNNIPHYDISSLDENTPAFENLTTDEKRWCLIGFKRHRLTGPAVIWPSGREDFYLNGLYYENIHDWLNAHPNQDNAFQIEMLLKYT